MRRAIEEAVGAGTTSSAFATSDHCSLSHAALRFAAVDRRDVVEPLDILTLADKHAPRERDDGSTARHR